MYVRSQSSWIARHLRQIMRGTSRVWIYSLTAALIALATAMKLLMTPMLGERVPFITYYPVVLLATLLGGAGPGLVTTTASCVISALLMAPAGELLVSDPADLMSLLVFACMSIVMVYLAEELRRALTAAENTSEQLVRSQEQLRLMIENAKDYAIFSLDPQGRIERWSSGAQRIFGYSEAEIIGTDAAILFTSEDIERRAPQLELQRAVIAGRAEDERWHVRKDGTQFFASGVVRPMRDPEGQLVGFTKIARDMTERQRSEDELLKYREKLEDLVAERTEALKVSLEQLRRAERLASIGTLAAGVAHEINNPLNSILLTADYARRFPEDSEPPSVYETIIAETQRCGRIVRGILKFAREETTPKEPRDVNELLTRVASMQTQYLPSENVSLELELSGGPEPVRLNATEFEQVIVNLLKNAAEAAGGRQVRVVIRTTREGEDVVIEIEDNGPGIAQETLRQIFDPFFSTRRHTGGTGLGLSICHSMVTEHGGTITAQSRVGQGTTFIISLPLADAGRVPAHNSSAAVF